MTNGRGAASNASNSATSIGRSGRRRESIMASKWATPRRAQVSRLVSPPRNVGMRAAQIDDGLQSIRREKRFERAQIGLRRPRRLSAHDPVKIVKAVEQHYGRAFMIFATAGAGSDDGQIVPVQRHQIVIAQKIEEMLDQIAVDGVSSTLFENVCQARRLVRTAAQAREPHRTHRPA